jgi:hypothetical protein
MGIGTLYDVRKPFEGKAMADMAALLGTWNVTSWKREIVATGETIDTLGPDPIGYINYGPDGRFYALVVSRDRLTPATPPSDARICGDILGR